ncbi:hypothetical protein L6164_025826 [Bauhinia variegata]|uniref:Uncharacterized protein n=1 Tax=Bauhinia variegata TaxID=167791 RepID=A0ACB9M1G4_BAUVA|nr:hypothetical protein L6164_025826 [Bauhinia variegata]
MCNEVSKEPGFSALPPPLMDYPRIPECPFSQESSPPHCYFSLSRHVPDDQILHCFPPNMILFLQEDQPLAHTSHVSSSHGATSRAVLDGIGE